MVGRAHRFAALLLLGYICLLTTVIKNYRAGACARSDHSRTGLVALSTINRVKAFIYRLQSKTELTKRTEVVDLYLVTVLVGGGLCLRPKRFPQGQPLLASA